MAEAGGFLVVGAGGFLGPALVEAALAAGEEVVAASRSPAAGLTPAERARTRLVPLDLLSVGALRALLADVRPRAVVLSAALSRLSDCARDPARARALNAALPEAVAGWCAAAGARFVHVSTDLVFGDAPAPRGGFREEDAPGAPHVYGRSKREGEERVLRAAPDALVVRLPLLFGPSRGRGLGASDALLAALARGERPALFADEHRTPLDVRDAARALVECARSCRAGLLHVAGPRRLSRLELGRAVLAARRPPAGDASPRADAAGPLRATTRAEAGLAAERPADVSLDASRARALLATPLRAPADALADAAP